MSGGVVTIVDVGIRERRRIPRDEIRLVRPGAGNRAGGGNISVTTVGMEPYVIRSEDMPKDQRAQLWLDLEEEIEVDVRWTTEKKLIPITEEDLRSYEEAAVERPAPGFRQRLIEQMVSHHRWKLVDGKPHEERDVWTREENKR